jgi:hypothetical protein
VWEEEEHAAFLEAAVGISLCAVIEFGVADQRPSRA